MSCLMFGPLKAIQPPRKMRERIRRLCVRGVVKSATITVSARSIIVLNILTPTLVGIMLSVRHIRSDMH